MQKLKERLPLKVYIHRLIQDINRVEQNYNEEMKENNPEKYIRNEYKNEYR